MSEERDLLRQTVAGLVDKHAGPEAVRRAMESALSGPTTDQAAASYTLWSSGSPLRRQ